MTETIKTIARIFKNVHSLKSLQFRFWQNDPRKGVQHLLKTKRRHLIRQLQKQHAFKSRWRFENRLYKQGYRRIAGIDEVGRGPLAGPVVTCAIVLPKSFNLIDTNDSKQLSPKRRRYLYPRILDQALDYSIGIGSNQLIDKVNIYQADLIAMKKAILALAPRPDFIIVDAMHVGVSTPQLKLYHGDARSISVGAASIVAKVYRDHLMDKYGREYPQYDFKHNAGYGTREHLQALRRYGVTPIHRLSFSPVAKYK